MTTRFPATSSSFRDEPPKSDLGNLLVQLAIMALLTGLFLVSFLA